MNTATRVDGSIHLNWKKRLKYILPKIFADSPLFKGSDLGDVYTGVRGLEFHYHHNVFGLHFYTVRVIKRSVNGFMVLLPKQGNANGEKIVAMYFVF